MEFDTFFEWLIVYAFLMNAYFLFLDPDMFDTVGPVANVITSTLSLWAVATMFLVLAVALGASKIFKKKKLHKFTLFLVYVVLVYVTVLEFVVSGWSVALLDNAFLMVGCAYCWLRWKFQTEYLNPKEFRV